MVSYKLECESAEPLFMGSMEGMLTESEQEALAAHLAECEHCREELEVYKTVWATLSAEETDCDAPMNFESGVMQKVESLPSRDSIFECVGFVIIGAIAALVGALGTIFYEDIAYTVSQVIAAPERLPIIGGMLADISTVAADATTSIAVFFLILIEIVTQARFILLAIFAMLILLQFVVYRFKKVW